MSAIEEAGPRNLATFGNPNSGKTAVFNALTGSRQKVANYPGVTVERKSGLFRTPAGRTVNLIDLPGTYSLRARSPDEEVGRSRPRHAALRRRFHQSAHRVPACA